MSEIYDGYKADKERLLKDDLVALLNKYSQDSLANTPDFILADYLLNCLKAFRNASKLNQEWHQKDKTLGVGRGLSHKQAREFYNR